MFVTKRALFRTIERERAQHRLELANLLDRLASATGSPWTPPPSDVDEWRKRLAEAQEERREYEAAWTASPEQDAL